MDQATVTRHKYNVRKDIEQLYPDGEFDCKAHSICFYEPYQFREKISPSLTVISN